MIDRIIIDVEGDINRFKKGLIKDFKQYKGYKITDTTENRPFKENGIDVQKQVYLLTIEDAISGKKRITLIPGNNTIKIIIPGKNEKSLEDKINQFISKTPGFSKIEKTPPIGKPKPGKMKKAKLKEIIKSYVKEAIQRT
jgi:hypothetical protein